MYYEEQVINGVLHWRGTPTGDWQPMSAERLTAALLELRSAARLFDARLLAAHMD